MLIEKHSFEGGMDGDTNQRLLPQNTMLNCMNAKMAVTEYGRNLRLENFPGTTLVPNLVRPPYGTDQTIGTAQDDNDGRIIYFNYNSFGDHAIYCYDPALNRIFALLYDSQVIGGLGFSRDSLIHSAKVENGNVYWVDSTNNEPRRLNINAAIKMNAPDMFSTFTLGQPLLTSALVSFLANDSIRLPAIYYSFFVVGQSINISGSNLNDGYYTVTNKQIILGNVLVRFSQATITNEAAGATVTISEADIVTITPYTYSMNQSVIRWIRRQPGLVLTATKQTDATYNNNFIKNEAFQFSWRYIYRDYEQSTLSGQSLLINYNQAADTFNYVTVTAPLGEFIDQDVIQIDFVVKYLNGGKSFIFKSWNRAIAADEYDVYNHNYNSIPLTTNFYNDLLGTALDDAYSVKPFDSVPIYAETCEMARFRSFMFNYTIGYDTPITTSLTAAGQESTAGTLTGRWVKIVYNFGASTHYYIDVGSLGFFDTGYQPPPFLATEAYADMTLVASGPAAFAIYILSIHPTGWIGGIQYTGDSSEITGGPAPPDISGSVAFKSGASYQAAIEFLDHSGRKCGIIVSPLKVNIPERSYDQIDYTIQINWSLSNSNAFDEIPAWAYYYSINLSKCLTTRFFEQLRGVNITYATKDVDGTYLFNTAAYTTILNGVAIDISSLDSVGMGYVFSDGDLAKVYIDADATVYNLSIVAQDGNWIICELKNLGALGDTVTPKTDFLFEIYTPYKASTSEPAYEVAQIYAITNPATVSRTYSTTAGSINGDITLLTRNDGTNDYLTENMSPNDKFYLQWNTDSGRPNFIDTIGQVVKTNTVAWSNVIIQGTKTNGLSTYDALDTKDISLECGDGKKLQVANKISDEQGSIMLAICQHQTASCYLGEVQLVAATQNAFIASAPNVIGTVNILQGSFGTINPESVFEHLGLVFFQDIPKGAYVQYSNNGLEPVSRYNQSRFFKNYSAAYLQASMDNLDNINGFHHLRSSIDPFTKEVLVTLPALIYENYADVLPSYTSVPSYATSIVNRFDIFDQLQKTMSFQYQENKWGSNYEWIAEWSEYLQNQSYLFKNGNLYIPNSDTTNWNTVFGVEYPVRVCITANVNPSLLKDLGSIAVEANAIPDYTVAMSNYPEVQISDLASTDPAWVNQQGIFYASFLRDRLSPNSVGTADEKLFTGDELTDVALFIMCEFAQYNGLFYCNFINIGWQASRGQRAIASPINK